MRTIELVGFVPTDDRVNNVLGELLPLHLFVTVDINVMEELDQPIYELIPVRLWHRDRVLHQ